MARTNRAYGLDNPLQPLVAEPVLAQRAPTANDIKNYNIGQVWIDQLTAQVWTLANRTTWSLASPGASDIDTLTGDSGGAISPIAGNIDILGGDGVEVVGTAGTLTISLEGDSFPITPFVVGPSGQAGYQTIQTALDAADAAGGGMVFVQPGTYTEDLTLYDLVTVWGDSALTTIIVGTHTPPTSGSISFQHIKFEDATTVFSSAAAGTTIIVTQDCEFDVANGYAFDLANWTGAILLNNCGVSGTEDGFSNNTGGSPLSLFNCEIGAGSANAASISGTTVMKGCSIYCPVSFVTGAVLNIDSCDFNDPVTLANDSTGDISASRLSGGATAALTMSSSAAIEIVQSSLDSSANPALAGAGAGTLTIEDLSFTGSNSAISASLTVARGTTVNGTVRAITFDTDVAAAGVTLTGTTLAADGTDANIPITVTPKGTGDLLLTVGSLSISEAAQGLFVEGGAATDRIGTLTLALGTATVANTNIAATDRILLTRVGVGLSTALGTPNVVVNAGASFVVTALDPTDASTPITGDLSTFHYFIVGQL